MYKSQIVLELLVLYVGISHSWDIAVTHQDLLEFYTNEVKTHTFRLGSAPRALAYDEVHDIVLYVDRQSNYDAIYGYGIPSNTYQCFLDEYGRNIHGLAFDPVTELAFFSDKNERSINWITLTSETNKNAHLIVKLDDGIPTDIAVDSCNGYVYWITTNLPTPKIERIRFDGSDREVILDLSSLYTNSYYKLEPHSLIIDQGTQKMYWMEPRNTSMYTIYYADLNGENKLATTLINLFDYKFTNPASNTMTVTKSNLFMSTWCSDCDRTIMKLVKTEYAGESYIPMYVKNQIFSLVAKNPLKIQDIRFCEALACIEKKDTITPYCVHGEKVYGRCLCKCTPGYIGKRCDVAVCDNYCFHGYCSVNDEGLPKCSCNTGYSGERCENFDGSFCVHGEKSIGQSSCKCTPGYIGERCDVAVCDNYCFHGYCSVNDDGLPKCSCNTGYSGERCENSDGSFCVHGEKSIGESGCKCAPGYIGERCDLSVCVNYCLQGNCSVNDEGVPKCRCNAGYSGERCEINVCCGYCKNNGICSLNEEDEPSCQCVGKYEGSRCEVSRT